MTKARCKFVVSLVSRSSSTFEEIKLEARYDPDLSEEDAAFSASTPSGTLTFSISNPKLIGKFNPGEAYYVDLTPVD